MTPGGLDVVVVTTSFPVREESASGIFVARLVDHLPDDFSIQVITPACPGSRMHRRRDNCLVRPVRYAPERWQLLAHRPGGIPAALKANRWLRILALPMLVALWLSCLRAAARADVLHANWAINGCVAGLAGFLRGVPVVTSLRGSDVASARRSWLSRLILHLALLFSRRVVCVSRSIEAWAGRSFPRYRSRLCVIENGVDAEFLNIGRARADKHDSRPFTLMTICSLIPGKGVDVIIRALAELRGHPEIVLHVVGDGPEAGALRERVRELGLAGRVVWAGPVEPRDIPQRLAAADGFVLASYSEGRPNVVLEAMAAGLPVIATDIKGVSEIIRNERTGLLFRPGDVAGLASGIARLHNDAELRRRLGDAAHAYIVEQGFLWNATAQRYAALFRQVAQEARH